MAGEPGHTSNEKHSATGKGSAGIVFIVEDDASLRAALASLVRSAGYDVAAFGSATEFLASPRPRVYGCLLLDVRLPDVSGLELQRALAGEGNQLPIIFMTGHGDIRMSVEAMKAGAVDFLSKPFEDEDVLRAIRAALKRACSRLRLDSEIASIRGRLASLTQREHEVMVGIVSGKLNKQIAAELGVGEWTVKVHRRHVMRKMSVTSLAELVRLVGHLESELDLPTVS